MKILWVTNVKIPIIYKLQNGINQINIGGWLDQISQGLLQNDDIELTVCYPFSKEEHGTIGNLSYIGIPYDGKKMRLGKLDDSNGVEQAESLLKSCDPAVIHIHGSEFQYHWFFAQAAVNLGMSKRVLVSIQGLVSVYAKHFALGLPNSVINAFTLRELLGQKNVAAGIRNFIRRGQYEEKTIQLASHIMGRTSWDRACTARINQHAQYHLSNETLREVFYSGNWNLDACTPHRIFISQASYPVKGFHLFIEGLRDIIKFYPDTTVHVAGIDILKSDRINGNSYGLYIKSLLQKYGLENSVEFCGNLNEKQMKKEMLEANVFVSPSTIENSPNSVGEAMLLGVPVVSSGVGGVMDLLKHGEEGFIYQSDAPYMLAYYVMKVFQEGAIAEQMGKAARLHAIKTHDFNKNLKNTLNVYNEIAKG